MVKDVGLGSARKLKIKSDVFLIKFQINCVAISNGVKKVFCAKQPGLNTYPISHNLTLTAGCVNHILFSMLLFVFFLHC